MICYSFFAPFYSQFSTVQQWTRNQVVGIQARTRQLQLKKWEVGGKFPTFLDQDDVRLTSKTRLYLFWGQKKGNKQPVYPENPRRPPSSFWTLSVA